jgi:hypothetical protein
MKNGLRTTLTSLILIASILACNLPGSGEQLLPPEDVQTAAALTVEALLMPPSATTTEAGAGQTRVANTSSPTSGPTGTITPTYSVPILRVLEQTNCRTGPGQDYEVVYTYLSWKELEIVGAYPQENYWLVKSPESPSGECWLWGGYVEVKGSYWVVSSVTPPPTATKAPPSAPSIQNWEFFCSAGQMTITILWTDRASNESGYRVIRDDVVVAELPADSNRYTETITVDADESVTYYIEVYGPSGTVRSTPIRLSCQS